jgi:hypothetical protein
MPAEVEQERPLPWQKRVLAFLIFCFVHLLCRTLRLTVIGQGAEAYPDGAILVTWHGRTLIPIWRYRRRGYWALISISFDGDLQAQNFRLFGFRVIRGSTGRRAVLATREILKALEGGGVLAFTPDGPRGPSQKVQEGVIYFAKKSGKPIIPVGIAASSCWFARSWDSYMVPKPFSRARHVYGEPVFIAPDEDNEAACLRVAAGINAAQAAAEKN